MVADPSSQRAQTGRALGALDRSASVRGAPSASFRPGQLPWQPSRSRQLAQLLSGSSQAWEPQPLLPSTPG